MMHPERDFYDVIVIGGGPAGSVAAALCAEQGLSTLVLERAVFPREKVCGDCVNPKCWEIIRLLRLEKRYRNLPHSAVREVRIIGPDGKIHRTPLPRSSHGEVAVKRSLLDQLLLQRAREFGAEVCEGITVHKTTTDGLVTHASGQVQGGVIIGADGRNSLVARSIGFNSVVQSDRVGIQAHTPLPPSLNNAVELHFLEQGYCGLADVGNDTLNACLVGPPKALPALKQWLDKTIPLDTGLVWRSITPLARTLAGPCKGRILLTGDAARVVEPFTGEGIYYAMKSSALAAEIILESRSTGWNQCAATAYRKAHERMYRGRLWVNILAKMAVTNPAFSRLLLGAAAFQPGVLSLLTQKVIGHKA